MRAGNRCAIVGNSATPGYVNLPSISWKLPPVEVPNRLFKRVDLNA